MSDLQDRMKNDQAVNRLAYATYQQLKGFIPVDKQYYPIMAAFVECEKQEAIHKTLRDLLHAVMLNDGPENNKAVHEIVLALQDCGNKWNKAIHDFHDLTQREGRNENQI